jgi:hypothetical protein
MKRTVRSELQPAVLIVVAKAILRINCIKATSGKNSRFDRGGDDGISGCPAGHIGNPGFEAAAPCCIESE